MAKQTKKSHGGRRAGAGRKPVNLEGKTVVIAVSVPSELIEKLDAICEQHAWNRSQAVTEAIRQLVIASE